MAIVFGYTPATNLVVVTGGTAGVPATFADFVTADRAGSYTVMDAIATAMNLVLDRLIRPVEFRALKITFTLAGTNAGAGDTVDITGTDAWGNAQVESINVAAGNGVYVSAKYWRTITDIDCTGFADGVGTINAVQPQWGVIWDYGLSQYQLDSFFTVGDGIIATHFRTDNETITWSGFCPTIAFPIARNNSTLYSGNLVEGLGVDGSIFNFCASENIHFFAGWQGTQYFYGCRFNIKTGFRLYLNNDSSLQMLDTVINFETGANDTLLLAGMGMTRGIVASTDGGAALEPLGAVPTITGLITNLSEIKTWAPLPMTILDTVLTNTTTQKLQMGVGQIMHIKDVVPLSPTLITIGHADGVINQEYTVNIHVSDKDGVNLQNAAVLCEDVDGNIIGGFAAVNTDVNGDIVEQTIIFKQWTTVLETLKDYSPHKFTISKAGYETLVLDDITIDFPIVWHLELLPALAVTDVRNGIGFGESKTGSLDLPSINDVEKGVQFDNLTKTGTFKSPAEADVRDGEGYGAGDVEFTGALDLPSINDVEDGVFFDSGTKEGNFEAPSEDDVEDGIGYGSLGTEFEGNLEIPIIGDVRDGIGYGSNGTEFEGVLDLPSINDVEDGVFFDNTTKEGNFEAPAEEDVEVGVGYGSLGTEFTGTYVGLKGENLTAVLEESVVLTGELTS